MANKIIVPSKRSQNRTFGRETAQALAFKQRNTLANGASHSHFLTAMSSAPRSSSGVRNLRAMFENNKSDLALDKSPDRGRSPSARMGSRDDGLDKSPALGPRKVTSTFVHVSPVSKPPEKPAFSTSASSNQDRMPQFVDSEEVEQCLNLRTLKQTYTKELKILQAARANESNNEGHIKSPLATPTTELTELKLTSDQSNGNGSTAMNGVKAFELPEQEKATEHSEKRVSAVEDKGAKLTAADPKNASLTSTAGKTLNGTGKKDFKLKKPATKTTAAAAKEPVKREQVQKPKVAPRKSISSVTSQSTFDAPTQSSLTHQQKAALSNEPAASSSQTARHVRVPTKPANIPSRLTAPTASSAAKKESSSATNSSSTTSKARTKELSSHLLAPTAASAAKHATEPQLSPKTKTATKTQRQSLAPSNSASKPRLSTARHSIDTRKATSTEVETKARKVTRPSESFLERMTRPTTASNSKSNEKTDANTSPHPAQTRKSRTSSVRTSVSEKKSDAADVAPQSAISKASEESSHLNSTEDTAPEAINESELTAPLKSEAKDESASQTEVSTELKTTHKSDEEIQPETEVEEKAEEVTKDEAAAAEIVDEPETESEKTLEVDAESKVEAKDESKDEVAEPHEDTTATKLDNTSEQDSNEAAVTNTVEEPLQLTEEQPTQSAPEKDAPEGVLPLTETKNDKPVVMGETGDLTENVPVTTSNVEEKEEEDGKTTCDNA